MSIHTSPLISRLPFRTLFPSYWESIFFPLPPPLNYIFSSAFSYILSLALTLAQYTELQQQALDMDAMELDTARYAIRPGKERETVRRLRAAYGKEFDSGMLTQSRKDVAAMLDESAKPVSIRQKLQQLQGQQNRHSHEKEHDQER